MINQDVIRRYLNGQATEEELRMLKTYLGNKDLTSLEEWMALDWENDTEWDAPLPSGLTDAMLHQVKQQIDSAKIRSIKSKQKRKRWIAAASFLILIGFGFGFWLRSPEPMVNYATGFGEWKTIELPDGSSVKLNANSKITYAEAWAAGEDRRVWLKGEAFFEVKKKPESGAKFQVITEDLQVEVLGTSFNVNSRGKQTDVFLEEGKVKLSLDDRVETLEPGDFLAYSAKKKAILHRENATPAELYISWKDGVLVLKDRQIVEILEKLEEIYGVKIKVLNQNLLTKIKTVSVPMDKLEIAIPVLERTFGASITQQGDQLVIQ